MSYQAFVVLPKAFTAGQFVGNFNTHLRRLGIILVSALFLNACSLTTFGYNSLPSLAQWQLDRYFNLTDAQKTLVNERLDALLRWHRANELPRLAKILNEIDDKTRVGTIDEAQIRSWREQVLARWQPTADQIAGPLAELTLSLSPEQIKRAQNRSKEANEKMRKEYLLEGTARQQARFERYSKRAEYLFARLEDPQTTYLKEISKTLPSTEPAWFAERLLRQEQFYALLATIQAQKPSLNQATELMRQHLHNVWLPKDPQRGILMAQSSRASDQISAELFRLANAEQKLGMSKKLQGYIQDLGKLAQQGQ